MSRPFTWATAMTMAPCNGSVTTRSTNGTGVTLTAAAPSDDMWMMSLTAFSRSAVLACVQSRLRYNPSSVSRQPIEHLPRAAFAGPPRGVGPHLPGAVPCPD